MSDKTISWSGKSGSKYKYWIYPLNTEFKKVPGNYIFAHEHEGGRFTPVYIGQTEDLSERFQNHHKMPLILRNDANCICVHISSVELDERLVEEQDLIHNWNPICNN